MLLFCATMSDRILKLAKRHMGHYELIRVKKEQLTVSLTEQIYFEVRETDKLEALCRIIDCEVDFYGLVFCRTKVNVDNVAKKLGGRGYDAEAIHGDISQHQRERILYKFRKKQITVLVATDVAARGIDISDLSHVINYALPQSSDIYIHRVGRTGRAGKEGTAITFITPAEYRKLNFIKKATKTDIRKKSVPAIAEVIKTKKQRIRNNIDAIVKSADYKEYLDYAGEIIGDNQPQEAMAAFIKFVFKDDLNKSNYGRIDDASVDKRGQARLFIAGGKDKGMDARSLVNTIEQIAKVKSRDIQDVCVLDKYSFISVPFKDAETIIRAFKQEKKHKQLIITHAKKKKEGGGGRESGGGRGSGGRNRPQGRYGKARKRSHKNK